ncbi:MAG: DUF3572 domain-containing protein [Hyphomicrobiales bacterium]|nr:DUF3572 domain-containing protein [Hyphomicrobiales bacterium]
MALKFSADSETSQTIALKALGYLAADEGLLEPFLGATGLAVADLRTGATDSVFLAGILDYFLQNEALLLAFAGASELAPETIVRARQGLPGALNDQ